jgi:hypothetical protein
MTTGAPLEINGYTPLLRIALREAIGRKKLPSIIPQEDETAAEPAA